MADDLAKLLAEWRTRDAEEARIRQSCLDSATPTEREIINRRPWRDERFLELLDVVEAADAWLKCPDVASLRALAEALDRLTAAKGGE